MRGLPDSVDELVQDATGTERLPDLGWNVSGYIAHMTDNTRIWAERLIAVARGADADVAPYDPDLLAESRCYNEVALPGVTWSFRIAVLMGGSTPWKRRTSLAWSFGTLNAAKWSSSMSSRPLRMMLDTTSGT